MHHSSRIFHNRLKSPSTSRTVNAGGEPLLNEVDPAYRPIFQFAHFNQIQATTFADLYHSAKSAVVCAPTGSGKTVLFELAIVKALRDMKNGTSAPSGDAIMLYISPTKALCQERVSDWKSKFERFGTMCVELTGDVDTEDLELRIDNGKPLIVCCTPEKLDSKSRLAENRELLGRCVLCCVDEIHVLSDGQRGATLETVVTRLRTSKHAAGSYCRFVAVSATVPNVDDIADWLRSTHDGSASSTFSFGNNERQVPIRKVVLAFDYRGNPFTFERFLTFKLPGIIDQYSSGRPTLVFCATRIAAESTCRHLASTMRLKFSESQRTHLTDASQRLQDSVLSQHFALGFAYHHAGLSMEDRQIVERAFREGHLRVVVATSGLSVGVNFPAHLVVIKSTSAYVNGHVEELTINSVLQMVGRAGRPQFDQDGVAVIMTTRQMKSRYDRDWHDLRVVDSALHQHIIEHLNAEVALGTISSLRAATDWLRNTFLYTRLLKNPAHYGLTSTIALQHSRSDLVDTKIEEWCRSALSKLHDIGAVDMDFADNGTADRYALGNGDFQVSPTDIGLLMSRFYVQYSTMSAIVNLRGSESVSTLLEFVSSLADFDMQLRQTEKTVLNELNGQPSKSAKAKANAQPLPDEHAIKPIRFRMEGRVKDAAMKTNCLLQSALDCCKLSQYTLLTDQCKAVRVASRLTRCVLEFLWLCVNQTESSSASVLTRKHVLMTFCSAVRLHKSFRCQLWYDSPWFTLQVNGIDLQAAKWLVSRGFINWSKIADADVAELIKTIPDQRAANRLIQFARSLPRYRISVPEVEAARSNASHAILDLDWITIHITTDNSTNLRSSAKSPLRNVYLIVGDSRQNRILHAVKLRESHFGESGTTDTIRYAHTISLRSADLQIDSLQIHLIDDEVCGVDVSWTVRNCWPQFRVAQSPCAAQDNVSTSTGKSRSTSRGRQQQEMRLSLDYTPATPIPNDFSVVNPTPRSKRDSTKATAPRMSVDNLTSTIDSVLANVCSEDQETEMEFQSGALQHTSMLGNNRTAEFTGEFDFEAMDDDIFLDMDFATTEYEESRLRDDQSTIAKVRKGNESLRKDAMQGESLARKDSSFEVEEIRRRWPFRYDDDHSLLELMRLRTVKMKVEPKSSNSEDEERRENFREWERLLLLQTYETSL